MDKLKTNKFIIKKNLKKVLNLIMQNVQFQLLNYICYIHSKIK